MLVVKGARVGGRRDWGNVTVPIDELGEIRFTLIITSKG